MARASGVDVNRGACLGETPCRARVIKVNMAEENVTHIGGGETGRVHVSRDVLKSGVRAGVEGARPGVRVPTSS